MAHAAFHTEEPVFPKPVLSGCQDCMARSKHVWRAALLAASCCVCPNCGQNTAEGRVGSKVFGGGKRPSQNVFPLCPKTTHMLGPSWAFPIA